jgi:hypothetical protein
MEGGTRQRENSSESLERIHTFSLKNSFQKKNDNESTPSHGIESKTSSVDKGIIRTL